jgi:hypothetical protein
LAEESELIEKRTQIVIVTARDHVSGDCVSQAKITYTEGEGWSIEEITK